MTNSLISTTINNAGKKTVSSYNGYAVTVKGKTDLHLTSGSAPLAGVHCRPAGRERVAVL